MPFQTISTHPSVPNAKCGLVLWDTIVPFLNLIEGNNLNTLNELISMKIVPVLQLMPVLNFPHVSSFYDPDLPQLPQS